MSQSFLFVYHFTLKLHLKLIIFLLRKNIFIMGQSKYNKNNNEAPTITEHIQ